MRRQTHHLQCPARMLHRYEKKETSSSTFTAFVIKVKDVSRSGSFYTKQLGFKLEHQQLPAFANVSLGNLKILLSGPGASGSRPMPDGHHQEPGGWKPSSPSGG